MPKKQKRAGIVALLPQSLLGLLLMAAIGFLLWAVWGIAQKEAIARKAVQEREKELMALEERRVAFAANVAELQTTRGQEAAVRKSHGVAKPGEEVIIVVPNTEPQPEADIPFWKRFMGWFGIWH